MFTMLITALFAWVFVQSLVMFVRGRDRLHRDVMLVFAAMAVVFLLALWRQVASEPPRVFGILSTLLLLGQPYLTLRLVAHVRPVPARWLGAAAAGWLVTSVPVAIYQRLPGIALLAAVVVFVTTETAAAVLLAAEGRRRAGAARTRLRLASAATALFAFAIFVAAAGTAGGRMATIADHGARITALVSALGYLAAFAPPSWLRRLWSWPTAYSLMRRLLAAPPDELPEQTWERYAEAVRTVTDIDAVAVHLPTADGSLLEVATVGLARDTGPAHAPATALRAMYAPTTARAMLSTAHLVDTEEPGAEAWTVALARRAQARYVAAVALSTPGGDGVLVLLSRRRSLFTEDDTVLLGELGAQAAILAERGSVLAERDHLVQDLASASKAKSDFLANMSHELRTPLSAIIGFSELMGGEESVGDRRMVPAEWITNVHTSGRHLLSLINDVLDLAKIESGQLELRPELIDAAQVAAEAVTALRPLIERKQLRVHFAVPPLSLHADRLRLGQGITNLLANAIKFTPPGGQITLAGSRGDGLVHLSVADTGPGIEAEHQQRVFEQFQQVGQPGVQASGTGLGLAITQRLIHAHGGRVELHSEPGHGARFTIVLPTEGLPAATGETAGATAGLWAPLLSPAGGNGRVLIVEDDPQTASLLHTYLDTAGYRLHHVATGEAALQFAAGDPPDAILLDLLLPGINGWEVLHRIRSQPRLRHIPVAIVTVMDECETGPGPEDVEQFVKPVERDALLGWLTRHGVHAAGEPAEPPVAVPAPGPA